MPGPKVFPGYSFNLALVFMLSSQHRLFSIDFYSLSGTKIRVFVGRLGNRTAITCGSCKSAHTVHTGQYSQFTINAEPFPDEWFSCFNWY